MKCALKTILILLIVSCIFAKNSLHKNDKKVRKNKKIIGHVVQLAKDIHNYIFPKPHVISNLSQNDIYINRKESARVDAIYKKFPGGIHNYTDATKSANMLVRTIDALSAQVGSFSDQTLYLNDMGVLFYARVDGHIREIVDSINLMDLVHGDNEGGDNISVGECCSFISEIDANVIMPDGDTGFSTIYNSFSISNGYTTWTISHNNYSTLLKFQVEIRMMIIRNWFTLHNKVTPSFIWEMNLDATVARFAWKDPEDWTGECATGKYQSPIGFARLAAQSVTGNRIILNYRWTFGASVRGNAAGNMIEIVGDFGHLTYTNQDGDNHEFYVTKVTLTTPAEHIIDNNQMNGEMQIHHQGADGSVAIVSYLLQQRSELAEEKSGAFWSALEYEKWAPQSQTPWSLKRRINLKTIIGTGQKRVNSFFLYKGSESTPPCEEGVYRFIMDQSIQISASYLAKIKQYASVYQSNARQIKFFIDVIYFQIDEFQCDITNIEDPDIQKRIQEMEDEFKNKNSVIMKKRTNSFRFKQRLAMRKSYHSRH